MKVSIIVAVARDGAIGIRGELPFHIPTDMRHFKRITMGKPVIMGRKTWESLPGGALPGRRNIVISHRQDYKPTGAELVSTLEAALEMTSGVPEVMIIGGGQIYRQALEMADRIYMTEIDSDVPGADTYFPALNRSLWVENKEFTREEIDSRSGLKLRFVCLSRK